MSEYSADSYVLILTLMILLYRYVAITFGKGNRTGSAWVLPDILYSTNFILTKFYRNLADRGSNILVACKFLLHMFYQVLYLDGLDKTI